MDNGDILFELADGDDLSSGCVSFDALCCAVSCICNTIGAQLEAVHDGDFRQVMYQRLSMHQWSLRATDHAERFLARLPADDVVQRALVASQGDRLGLDVTDEDRAAHIAVLARLGYYFEHGEESDSLRRQLEKLSSVFIDDEPAPGSDWQQRQDRMTAAGRCYDCNGKLSMRVCIDCGSDFR